MKKERINEIIAVVLLFVGAFLLAGLFFHHPEDHPFYSSQINHVIQNPTGIAGAYISHYLLLTLGVSSYFIPVAFFFLASCLFMQNIPNKKTFKFLGLAFFIVSATAIVTLSSSIEQKVSAGGLLGYLISNFLHTYFGQLGGMILSVSCLILSFLLATEFLLYPLLKSIFSNTYEWLSEKFQEKWEEHQERVEEREISQKQELKQLKKEQKLTKKKVVLEEEFNEEPKLSPFQNIALKVKRYDPRTKEEANKAKQAFMEPVKEELKKKPLLEKLFKSRKEDPDIEKKAEELMKVESAEIEGEVAPKERAPRKQSQGNIEVPSTPPSSDPGVSISVDKESDSFEYIKPKFELLEEPVAASGGKSEEDLTETSKILEKTLLDFGIQVKVVEVEQGPVITRFEILPAPGVKVNSIVNLEHDLALALKATSLRFIAPIPGKSAIGIELPNSTTNVVYMKELLQTSLFQGRKQKLPLVLGKDSSGKTLIADLTEMPHLLIAGTTGSGKTVCVNAIILGLAYALSPDELKFVMVDPKMVELAIYNNIPHMISPVVTDVRKASSTLNWVVGEMESRYRLLAKVGVRNIASFNSRTINEETEGADIPQKLPYIVLIIDELADLMMVAQDKVEGAITRLAQLSRAVGIHVIIATQRPSVDVITGVIKANFPARISFKVASKVDSRTVLDANGADALLGKGDMLFLEPGKPKAIRAQAAFVRDHEIDGVVKFIADQSKPEYIESLVNVGEQKASSQQFEKDELYDEALRIVLATGQASASMLQRKLRLGFGRASRIIDAMEEEGIVGPQQGSKPREILVSRDSYLEEDSLETESAS